MRKFVSEFLRRGLTAFGFGPIVLAAVYLMENGNIMYYFPVLMIAGLLTGILIGIGSKEVLKRMPKFW